MNPDVTPPRLQPSSGRHLRAPAKTENQNASASSSGFSFSCISEHAGIPPGFASLIQGIWGRVKRRLQLLEGLGVSRRSWRELAVAKHPIGMPPDRTLSKMLVSFSALMERLSCFPPGD